MDQDRLLPLPQRALRPLPRQLEVPVHSAGPGPMDQDKHPERRCSRH